jgi:hypothetical protein
MKKQGLLKSPKNGTGGLEGLRPSNFNPQGWLCRPEEKKS